MHHRKEGKGSEGGSLVAFGRRERRKGGRGEPWFGWGFIKQRREEGRRSRRLQKIGRKGGKGGGGEQEECKHN